jgi:O-methyltransferase domain/Dimerisation domain
MVGMEGVQVVSLSLGYVMGQALHAAATLGVADAMADGPHHVDEVAAATCTHAPSLQRLLRTLAGGGIVTESEPGRFALTTLGETLRRDVPGSVRSAVIWVSEPMHYGSCGELAHAVMTGEPAFDKIFGRPYFQHLAADSEAGRVWDEGMACFSAMEDAPIAGAYRFPSGARVVDIGGGQGGFLTEVLRGDPSLRGLLFDLPAVVEDPRVLREAGLLDRCELVGGDFFDAVPTGGDVYVLKRVLHDWDDATCVDLLTRCRAVVPDDGRLLVIDAVIPPGNDPHPAKIVDMVMMSILPGRERTEHELADLFSAAGFRLERVIPTHSMLAIAEGVPS